MNKLSGWFLIIICSLFLLIFASALLILLPGIIADPEVRMSGKEFFSSSLGFLIVIFLLILGLRKGIQTIKKERKIKTIPYDKELNISLSGEIKYADYRNQLLLLSFKRPIYLVLIGVLLLSLLTLLTDDENGGDQPGSNFSIYILIGVLLLSPVLTIIQIKGIYKTSSVFKQSLQYTLTNEAIHLKGNSLDATLKWSHFYMIRETRSFFMFYQGTTIATFLDKKMFSEGDLKEFQDFIKSLDLKRA